MVLGAVVFTPVLGSALQGPQSVLALGFAGQLPHRLDIHRIQIIQGLAVPSSVLNLSLSIIGDEVTQSESS